MDKMGRKALLRKEQSHMKINKVKDGIYPAKITSVYIASKKKVIFDLEIKVKRKKKVEDYLSLINSDRIPLQLGVYDKVKTKLL